MAVDECEEDNLRTLCVGAYASADSAEEHEVHGFARGLHFLCLIRLRPNNSIPATAKIIIRRLIPATIYEVGVFALAFLFSVNFFHH